MGKERGGVGGVGRVLDRDVGLMFVKGGGKDY